MVTRNHIVVAVTLVVIVAGVKPACAVPGTGPAARKAAQEAGAYVAEKLGVEVTREGGGQLAAKSAQLAARYGDDGLRLLRNLGPLAADIAARHGDDAVRMCAAHGDDAARILVRNVDAALPIWRQFGVRGTEVVVRHPGLGEQLIGEFGAEGVDIGRRLSPEGVKRLLLLIGRAAGKEEKERILNVVLRDGEKVLDFLWKHKAKIAAGAGAFALLREPENPIVTEEFGPDGVKTGENRYRSIFHQLVHDTFAKALQLAGEILSWGVRRATDETIERYPWVLLLGPGFLLLVFWRVARAFGQRKRAVAHAVAH
jgi:hypothetical protein